LARQDQPKEDDAKDGPDIPGLAIHEELGEGGFGIVYRATQVGVVKRRVALKVLKPGVDTRTVLKRFAIEQQALALLEHPYIARFYDAGETPDGYPWFTMEYIEGKPITEALAACNWESILEVFLNVCGAISFAHEKGVLHRDLKPSNILVTAEGAPKVIDFGLAKATDASPGMTLYTMDEVRVGTPAYSAPEKGAEVDVRSEVFSLGATLFELLTDLVPPENGDPLPRPGSLAVRKLPVGLDVVVQRAMALDPSDRYQTVREFGVDIRRVLQGESIRRDTKRRTCWIFGVPVILALVIVVVINWPGDEESEQAESKITFETVWHASSGGPSRIRLNRTGDRAVGVFRVDGDNLLFDPRDGRKLFTYPGPPFGIGSAAFDESGDRFLIGFSNGTFRWYSSEDGEIVSPYIDCTPGKTSWVPDLMPLTIFGEAEASVLTVNTDWFLRAWTETGELRWEVPLVSDPYSFGVSPDKKMAVIGSRGGTLNLINLQEASKTLLEGHKDMIFRIVYSGSGSFFACASYDGRASIWHDDGRQHRVLRHQAKVEQVVFSPDDKYLASASWDGTARVWDVDSGKQLQRLEHSTSVLTVAFSHGGEILASGGKGNKVRLWNVATGDEICQPIDCGGSIEELCFVDRGDGSQNLIVLTKEVALRVIKFADLPVGE